MQLQKVMEQCAEEHDVSVKDVRVIDVLEGNGIHRCGTGNCYYRFGRSECMAHLDDSHWIVTMAYNTQGNQAIYGVIDDSASFWMESSASAIRD